MSGGKVMRTRQWSSGVAVAMVGVLSFGLVHGGTLAAAGAVYPTADACWQAEQKPCYRHEQGWSPEQDVDPGNVIGTKLQRDEENLRRQGMSMPTNFSGSLEHPVVAVDMNRVVFPDVQPYLDTEIGRVRVPVRFVSEQMGAQVEWEQSTQTVTITRENLRVQLRVDDPVVTVNSTAVTIDAPPRLVDPGRVMVPLRFVSEVFGAAVDWVGTENPYPRDGAWGKYQVWIWVDWGYWGKYDLHERLIVQRDWFYQGPGR